MLLERLESVVMRTPLSPAVVAGDGRLAYGDLDKRSTALARHLAQSGIGPGDLVAVYMRRRTDVIVAVIGVMKSGAAYTVVEDDGHAAENCGRLRAVAPALVLYEDGGQAALASAGLRTIGLGEALASRADAPLPPPRAAHDPVYVLFTSGSTGKPKGVVVTHGNVAHYAAAMAERLGIDRPLRYAHVSTLAADLGNTSLFLSLWSGGCLHLVDADTRRDPAALRDYLVSREVQFLKITPSHWNAIFSAMSGPQLQRLKLRCLVLGGEVMPLALARRIQASGCVQVLLNHYGPTETTIGVSTFAAFEPGRLERLAGDTVPIGSALGRSQLRVRSEDGSFHERGARGELYIGGPSVAAGYLDDAQATADSFVTLNEPNAVGRFYRSGDQVEVDGEGVLHFLGRVDRQVKVNGYRVELEHVESLLRAAPGVVDAAAFFLEWHGKRRLVAALLGEAGRHVDALRQHLDSVMPGHMVPRLFVRMDEFPRNDNGKTHLKLLQARLEEQLRSGPRDEATDGRAEEDALGADIRGIWAAYLHHDAFDADESFFELGGDSLDAIQVIADLQLKGHAVTTNAFLARPTLNGLREAIARQAGRPADPLPELRHEARLLSPAQDFFFRQALADPDHCNQALLLECGERVDPATLRRVLATLVHGHPSLRMAYGHDAQGRVARPAAVCDEAVLACSSPPANAVEAHIEREAEGLQRSMSLADGRLFAAHLFQLDPGRDQLLLVAHHVAVDVVS
jgi:amino acid adenylation domain-containing protein